MVESPLSQEIVDEQNIFSRPLSGTIFDVNIKGLVKDDVVGRPTKRVQEQDKVLETYATTRSKTAANEKSRKDTKEPQLKKAAKKQNSTRIPGKEGIPKEDDPAYDRYDPKYFQPDISGEVLPTCTN